MLCIDLGVSSEIRADHLQYLKGWLKALDDDKAFIKDAAIQAQKAVDYLDSLQSKTQQAAA
jgi:antirestriction protein ArdC